MLSREELENIARIKRISIVNAEKDYLQELILRSIYSLAGKALVFKGGTCLYKIYKLGRFSEDLDFTLNGKINLEKLAARVISDLGMLGIKGRIKETKEHANETNIRLLMNGPLFKGGAETQCFIPLNISKKEKMILEPAKESVIPLYREIGSFDVFAMQEKEILAEKIRAISTRMKPRDIYDAWFLVAKKGIEFDLNFANKKLELYGQAFELSAFRRRVESMQGLWLADLRHLIIGELPDFNAVKKGILAHIDNCARCSTK
ncbi:MAG: nucleotidyl transferase AbiEii/AbiGii toxin family protein [Candidatus Nanoarchaeia archaeon]|nr:nucleotidyl transferase AbiEii/AbiGii toxin family protein [Candidatus Nanoarchaeia archaeon]